MKAEATTIGRRMAELRLACEREIREQRERAGLAASSFRRSLHSIRCLAQETLASREKLSKLRENGKQLEADLEESLAVKTRRTAKFSATAESLASTIARMEQLKKIVLDQKAKRDEYATVISQQLLALDNLEEKSKQDVTETKNIEEAILWYERVLGFQAEGGEGVKFIFNKIHLENQEKEYSFTIRLDDDVYNLLHCDPHVEDLSEMIKVLNKNNDLFKFVRIMREKFQVAALNGLLPVRSSVYPESTTVTVSSPPSISGDSTSETLTKQNDRHLQPNRGWHGPPEKVDRGKFAISSPQSVSALPRRSPRLTVKKFS